MAIIVPIIAKFVDDGLKDAQAKFKSANGAFAKTGVVLDSLAGPAKAVVAGMAGAGMAVAKNAGQAAKANAKLAASFHAVGYDDNAAAAMAYADSMQHVIGISDEEIQSTMQKLAAFDKVAASQDFMARATMAAADMSAAGFGTMDSAATQLGKALQDPTKNLGSLTRMGVTFTKQQKKQINTLVKSGQEVEAQNLILKEVEGTFGGVAEASASGSAKMKLAWDEAAETIGTTLVPILGILNVLLTKVANFAKEHSNAFLILGGAITALAATLVVANAAFKAYAIAVKIAGVAMKLFSLIMKSSLGPIGLIIAGVALLAVVIIKNWDTIKKWTEKVWGWISGFLSRTWGKIKGMASAIWNGIINVVKRAWDIIKAIIVNTNPFLFVIKHLDWIKAKVSAAWDWIKSKVANVWAAIRGIFNSNPFAAIQGWLEQVKNWFGSAWDWIKDKVSGDWNYISGIVGKVTDAVNNIKDKVTNLPGIRRVAGKSSNAAAVSRVLATEAARQLVGGVPVPQAATVAGRSGGGGGPTFYISGALDADAVGRQIKRLLENQDTRQGRVRGAPRRVAW